jgi:aldehyde:ferredoxin oxidoreductase
MRLWSSYDAIGLCLFAAPPTRNLDEESTAELVSSALGVRMRPEDNPGVRATAATPDAPVQPAGGADVGRPHPARPVLHPAVDGGRLAGAVLDRAEFEAATRRLRDLLGWPDDVD